MVFGDPEEVFPGKAAAGILDELDDGAKRHASFSLEKSGDHWHRVAVLFGPTAPGQAEAPDMSIELFCCDRIAWSIHAHQFNRTVI
jgi:hypothetical protein